jgi:hypothetical protein
MLQLINIIKLKRNWKLSLVEYKNYLLNIINNIVREIFNLHNAIDSRVGDDIFLIN